MHSAKAAFVCGTSASFYGMRAETYFCPLPHNDWYPAGSSVAGMDVAFDSQQVTARNLAVLTLRALLSTPASASLVDQAVSFLLGEDWSEIIDAGPSGEKLAARLPLAGLLHDLSVRNNRLYVARGILGITVIDVSDDRQPAELCRLSVLERSEDTDHGHRKVRRRE